MVALAPTTPKPISGVSRTSGLAYSFAAVVETARQKAPTRSPVHQSDHGRWLAIAAVPAP